jgi:8-oxo-dGTP pyrophosphatase MutT (NUDIX family)
LNEPPGDGFTVPTDPVEPVPAATVLVVIPGRGGIEVLMVRRPPRGLFGGVWVFPGGTVDSDDEVVGDVSFDQAFRRAAVRELAEEVGLRIDVDSLAFVSRWITPVIYPRRYDTHFYLAPLGSAPPLKLAVDEIEEATYITPAAALGAHQAQQWPMVLPTLAHLRWLARFGTIEEAIQSTIDRQSRSGARPDAVTPKVAADGSLLPIEIPW